MRTKDLGSSGSATGRAEKGGHSLDRPSQYVSKIAMRNALCAARR